MPLPNLPNDNTLDVANNATSWAQNITAMIRAVINQFGTAAVRDVGAADDQIPLNQNFGTAAFSDIGSSGDSLPKSNDLGDSAWRGVVGGVGDVVTEEHAVPLKTDPSNYTGNIPSGYPSGATNLTFSAQIADYDMIRLLSKVKEVESISGQTRTFKADTKIHSVDIPVSLLGTFGTNGSVTTKTPLIVQGIGIKLHIGPSESRRIVIEVLNKDSASVGEDVFQELDSIILYHTRT